MCDLSTAQNGAAIATSNSNIGKAVENILRSTWLLVSGLHAFFRELM
jgi:hypothetical protein